MTEVHHITGAGHDAGVVYSEIQGSKYATSSSRALKKKLYPGDSGYYALTGGKLENMRNSTTMEKVRKYHKQFYKPENLILTITGRIEEDQLFEAIRHIEEKVVSRRAAATRENITEYERPWSTELQPTGFQENHVFEHVFPDDDVDKAHVLLAWRLDHFISDKISELEALELMFKYLTSSKVSPMEQEFVQSEDPIASGVRFFSWEYSQPAFGLQFTNVPTNRTDEVIPRMEKVVSQVLAGGPQQFDLVRIQNYINSGLLKNKKENENGPHTYFPDATLLDKIYGTEERHFQEYVVANQWSTAHQNKTEQFWLELINNIFNERKYVAVKGIPSLELSRNLTETEAIRTAQQIETLGPEGLQRKAKELEDAVASQTLPSDEILSRIPLGDVNKILFRHLESYNRTHNQGGMFDFSSIPLKINIDDVKSKFVTIYIYMDLTRAGLSVLQRKYLPLLVDLWTTSPMIKNGTITDVDGVIKRYNQVLLKYEMTQSHSYITVGAQAELGKLVEAVEFIHDRINYPYFTKKDLERTVGKRLNKGTPSASTIKSELLDGIYFNNKTMEHYTKKLAQKKFLNQLKQRIEDGEAEDIIDDLYRMVRILGTSNNSFLHMAADARALTSEYGETVAVLSGLFNASSLTGSEEWLSGRYEVSREHQYRAVNSSTPQHVALGVDSTSSCYFTQTVMYNNTDWTDREVADARVLLKYLSDRMYHSVRGKGLTYSISMALSVSTGRVVLSISKSAQLTEAYRVVRQIFNNYTQVGPVRPDTTNEEIFSIQGYTQYDAALTDSSKGALIYQWAEKEETVSGLVSEAKKAYLRETDSHYNRDFTVSIADVTVEDISQVGKR